MKLYSEVRNISNKKVSLVTIKYNSGNTLNLEVAARIRVFEMKMNLKNILVPDMIYFHKQTGEVIYIDLMKDTLKVSKLQSTVSKIENQLRQGKVENKVH